MAHPFSVVDWPTDVDLLRNSIVEHHTEMKDRVFADSIKQSLSLAGVMRKRMAVMQEAGAKNSRLIKLRREKVGWLSLV